MKRAVTLIEILCVIAIIAILAGLIVPVVQSTRKVSKKSTSISNLRQIGMAINLYITDYDETIPPAYGSKPYRSIDTWVGVLIPYTGLTKDLYSDPTRQALPENFIFNNREYSWTWVPHYGINIYGYNIKTNGVSCEDYWGTGPSSNRKLAEIDPISERIMISPVTWPSQPVGFIYFKLPYANWPSFSTTPTEWSWKEEIWETRYGYNETIPILFADGHTKTINSTYFINNDAYPNITEYCKEMKSRDLFRYWGKMWE